MTETIIAKRLSGIPPSLILKLRHKATSPKSSVIARKVVYSVYTDKDVLSKSLATPHRRLVRRPATCVGGQLSRSSREASITGALKYAALCTEAVALPSGRLRCCVQHQAAPGHDLSKPERVAIRRATGVVRRAFWVLAIEDSLPRDCRPERSRYRLLQRGARDERRAGDHRRSGMARHLIERWLADETNRRLELPSKARRRAAHPMPPAPPCWRSRYARPRQVEAIGRRRCRLGGHQRGWKPIEFGFVPPK